MKITQTMLFIFLLVGFFTWAVIGPKPGKVAAQTGAATGGAGSSTGTSGSGTSTNSGTIGTGTTTDRSIYNNRTTTNGNTNTGIQNSSSNRSTIMEVQRQLYGQGLIESAPTGVMDDTTVEGINRFQRRKGLRATGSLNQETLDAMGVEDTSDTFAE